MLSTSRARLAVRPAPLALKAKDSGAKALLPACFTKTDGALATKPSTELAASSASEGGAEKKTNIALLAAYFFAWYALNVGYNITNKQADPAPTPRPARPSPRTAARPSAPAAAERARAADRSSMSSRATPR